MFRYFIFLLSLISLADVNAKTIHVPAEKTTIQAAIDFASHGDTILVHDGIYFENINFKGKNIIVGSLFLVDRDSSHIPKTILDGNKKSSVVTFEGSEDSTSVLIGFTVLNGAATDRQKFVGGGIYCGSASPRLENLIVKNNVALSGGGIFLSARTQLTNVKVIANKAFRDLNMSIGGNGGGIFCADTQTKFVNVTVADNDAESEDFVIGGDAGGVYVVRSALELIDSKIENNTATGSGGGIFCDNSQLFIFKTSIRKNQAVDYGGGIYLDNSTLQLVNGSFCFNEALGGGGVNLFYSKAKLERVVFLKNRAIEDGGGIFCNESKLALNHSTFFDNIAARHGGGVYGYRSGSNPILVNSIVWYNFPQGIYLDCPSVTLAFCNIDEGKNGIGLGGGYVINWQEGNIDAYPVFVDSSTNDLRLQAHSPCIDSGTSFFVWQNDTLSNQKAFEYFGIAPDIGAFEFYPIVKVTDPTISAVTNFLLYQNHPNPFNPSTTIQFSLPRSSYVTLKIYNTLGQEMTTLVAKNFSAGNHQVVWEAQGMASGIYFCRLRAADLMQTRKLVLLR